MQFEDINENTEDNIGGSLNYILIADADWITSFPEIIDQNIIDEITLSPGKNWGRWNFSEESGKLRDERDHDNDGYIKTISFLIPRDRLELQKVIMASKIKRAVVIHISANGEQKVVGTNTEPAQVILEAIDNKDERSARNEYELIITAQSTDPAPFYQAELPEEGESCLPVEIKNYFGTVVATIPSGGTYTLPLPPVTWDNTGNCTILDSGYTCLGNTTGGTGDWTKRNPWTVMPVTNLDNTIDIRFTYQSGGYGPTCVFGLAHFSKNDNNFTDIDYAVQNYGGTWYIIEEGVNQGAIGAAVAGDVIRMTMVLSGRTYEVSYYLNNVLVYTSSVGAAGAYKVKASWYDYQTGISFQTV